MEGEKGVVCVTGGTGYVASWLIMRLLQHGYSVRATVRYDSEGNKKDISYLTTVQGASEKLQIFNADLEKPDSFNDAIQGCIGVFLVATPIDFEGKEPEETVTKRAINGTLGILKACLNSKTVKRVVYTSSASAVAFNDKKEVDMKDENEWSDVDFIRALKSHTSSYMISKTLTEKAALKFAEEHGLDLVTLIPSFVTGPFICPRLPGSVRITLFMIMGNRDEYLLNTSIVHVDDVAAAHIFLLEHPNPNGRYICSFDNISLHTMSEFLSAKYPEFQIPTIDSLKDIKGYKIPSLTSKKLLDLGFRFKYGLDEMYDGAIQCCKEKGFL